MLGQDTEEILGNKRVCWGGCKEDCDSFFLLILCIPASLPDSRRWKSVPIPVYLTAVAYSINGNCHLT